MEGNQATSEGPVLCALWGVCVGGVFIVLSEIKIRHMPSSNLERDYPKAVNL